MCLGTNANDCLGFGVLVKFTLKVVSTLLTKGPGSDESNCTSPLLCWLTGIVYGSGPSHCVRFPFLEPGQCTNTRVFWKHTLNRQLEDHETMTIHWIWQEEYYIRIVNYTFNWGISRHFAYRRMRDCFQQSDVTKMLVNLGTCCKSQSWTGLPKTVSTLHNYNN